jgi:sterol 3beta-glucosyltransferase
MKILISTFGVRGDVQPYLALAVGLQAAGHHVTLATSDTFTRWIESYGIHTHPTRFSLADLTLSPEGQAVLKSNNVLRLMGLMRAEMRQSAPAQDDTWAAMQSADLAIQSPAGCGAFEAAALRGLPVVLASPVPFAPTRAFPSVFLGAPGFSLGTAYNTFTHHLMHRVLWSMMGGPLSDHLRRKLGLRRWGSFGQQLAYARAQEIPMLYGFSEHVLPRPADWDATQRVTGYWFLEPPAGWSPPNELQRFLDDGPAPVYIGFGSIVQGDAEARTRLALRALELTGQRGVLSTGWGGLARQAAPPTVYIVEDVPHAWLFPRMAAVVHHGGAGTTAAGLRAGVPSLLAPFAADQFFWAERVSGLGVGPRLPGMRRLTVEALAAGIHTAVTDTALHARAAALGEQIRAEDGLAAAVALIERHAVRPLS